MTVIILCHRGRENGKSVPSSSENCRKEEIDNDFYRYLGSVLPECLIPEKYLVRVKVRC